MAPTAASKTRAAVGTKNVKKGSYEHYHWHCCVCVGGFSPSLKCVCVSFFALKQWKYNIFPCQRNIRLHHHYSVWGAMLCMDFLVVIGFSSGICLCVQSRCVLLQFCLVIIICYKNKHVKPLKQNHSTMFKSVLMFPLNSAIVLVFFFKSTSLPVWTHSHLLQNQPELQKRRWLINPRQRGRVLTRYPPTVVISIHWRSPPLPRMILCLRRPAAWHPLCSNPWVLPLQPASCSPVPAATAPPCPSSPRGSAGRGTGLSFLSGAQTCCWSQTCQLLVFCCIIIFCWNR